MKLNFKEKCVGHKFQTLMMNDLKMSSHQLYKFAFMSKIFMDFRAGNFRQKWLINFQVKACRYLVGYIMYFPRELVIWYDCDP